MRCIGRLAKDSCRSCRHKAWCRHKVRAMPPKPMPQATFPPRQPSRPPSPSQPRLPRPSIAPETPVSFSSSPRFSSPWSPPDFCASSDSLLLATPAPLVPRASQLQRPTISSPRRTLPASPAPLSLIRLAALPAEPFLFCEAWASAPLVRNRDLRGALNAPFCCAWSRPLHR